MTLTITVTDAASTYIEKWLKKENAVGFRLSIKKTGCSGYSYAPSIMMTENPNDEVISTVSGIKIFVDSTWVSLLQGVCIDYVEEDKSGLKQKKLMFTNPSESSRCGCGESFHVDVK